MIMNLANFDAYMHVLLCVIMFNFVVIAVGFMWEAWKSRGTVRLVSARQFVLSIVFLFTALCGYSTLLAQPALVSAIFIAGPFHPKIMTMFYIVLAISSGAFALSTSPRKANEDLLNMNPGANPEQ